MFAKYRWLFIFFACLVMVLVLFYALFWRHITPFDSRGIYVNGITTPERQVKFIEKNILPFVADLQMGEPTEVMVFHWLDIDCKCTLLGKPFIEKLTTSGKPELVRHIVLTKPNQLEKTNQWLALAENVTVLALPDGLYQKSRSYIPSSPGASIYNRQAQSLSYFGPHSSGVTCGQGSNFIELVLNNLSHGFDPKLYQFDSEGCFCSW